MATVVGEGIVPVVPSMKGFQSQVAGEIKKSATGLRSSLAGAGKLLGITLGAAMAVSIGKKSLEVFDTFEQAEKRLEFGLAKLGPQGAADLEPITAWAKDLSTRSGVLTQDIVGMASKLTAMGTAFFRAAGPDATKAIENLTGGLTDMAAATGKTASMLMRSLGPAILNTPAKAIPLLQKFGVLTAEQAAKITALAAAGKNYEATQAEINAITTKYAGAAAASATSIDKLKSAWNNVEISIGGVISKGADVLLWLSSSATAAVVTRDAIVALVVAYTAMRFVPLLLNTIAASMIRLGTVSVAAAAASEGLAGLAVSAAAVAGPIGLAVAALGLLALGLSKIDSQATITAQHFDQVGSGGIGVGRAWTASSQQTVEAATRMAVAAKKTQESVVTFAHMSAKALKDWVAKIQSDAASAISSIGGVTAATHHTTRAFINGSAVMRRAAEQSAKAIRALAKQNWVPDNYKKWLLDQGPAAVANFESANKKHQKQAVSDWRGTSQASESYQRTVARITGQTGSSVDNAASKVDALARHWQALKNIGNINLQVVVGTSGSHGVRVVPFAAGGVVRRPTLALIGEAGPEAVVPLGGQGGRSAAVSPLGGGGPFLFTITNWEEGKGYIVAVASDVDRDDANFSRGVSRMRIPQ